MPNSSVGQCFLHTGPDRIFQIVKGVKFSTGTGDPLTIQKHQFSEYKEIRRLIYPKKRKLHVDYEIPSEHFSLTLTKMQDSNKIMTY